MKYLEINFYSPLSDENIYDLLAALLADIGFESFMETEKGINAYIREELFREEELKNILENFPMENTKISYSITQMEDKNWNEEWEKNFFRPLVIEDRCVVHSTCHTDIPATEYEIIINPQMAFGTGHHETTSLIIGELLENDLTGKSVLDMGCGTAILAILARKRGATSVTAIDIDTWCVNNSLENIALNQVDNIQIEQGDASALPGKGPFDVVIANINRNILLEDMKYYVASMKEESEIYISGFYTDDMEVLHREATRNGLIPAGFREKNRWAVMKFVL
ncbi:MAG: 50S ribosomal protein L11 methyltransferase [Bacteroides sp.]|nr:50S ribosomal protein L11 methyltransferase [Bacteroides sp.]